MQKLPVSEVFFKDDISFGGARGGLRKMMSEALRPRVVMYLNEYRFLVIAEPGFEDLWVPVEQISSLKPCPQQQTTSSKSKKAQIESQRPSQSETDLPPKLF